MSLIKFAAAAAVAGAAVVGPAPALAAEPCATPLEYAAGAGAEALRLGALDLRPLGLPLGPVVDVRAASTRSGMVATGPVNSAAVARHLDAKVAGVTPPADPLDAVAYQQSPPRNAEPVTVPAPRRDLGVVEAGAGDLSAHATWRDGLSCGARAGFATKSSATVDGVAVLPGPAGTALVRVASHLRGRTETGLIREGGAMRSVATTAASFGDVTLFAGTPTAVRITVVRTPVLTVGTGGTAATTTVAYRAPILQVSGPGIPTQRIDAPGETIDLALPRAAGDEDAARADAKAHRLPLVAGDPLTETLGALHPDRLRGATGQAGAGPLGLPKLAGVPDPGEFAGGLALPALGGELSLARISLGAVQRQLTSRSVRAQVASVRVQVAAGIDGSLVDLALGELDAAAIAPAPQPAAPPPAGAGGGLPITGVNTSMVVALGVFLLCAGAALLIAARPTP
ncbi:hypothetical protein WEI85_41585 [Actinomycetes bacterium KLBMP 9797]